MMAPYLLIALGGVIGANARFLISNWAADRFGIHFPFGTLIINLSGSFVMGLFLTLAADQFGDDPNARWLVATGFLSSYTTFSTFSFETIALVRRGALRPAVINAVGSAGGAIAAAGLGIAIASALGTTG